jgi:hypothetical protein
MISAFMAIAGTTMTGAGYGDRQLLGDWLRG